MTVGLPCRCSRQQLLRPALPSSPFTTSSWAQTSSPRAVRLARASTSRAIAYSSSRARVPEEAEYSPRRCSSRFTWRRLHTTPESGARVTSRGHKVDIRAFSSSTSMRQEEARFEKTTLSPGEYNKAADTTLDLLQDKLERIIENAQDDVTLGQDWDIEGASGVLNVKLGSRGTYVINKQPPNQQMWLSSPSSGPKRFDFGHRAEGAGQGSWFSLKEGETHELWSLLRREFAEIVGEEEASILTPEEE